MLREGMMPCNGIMMRERTMLRKGRMLCEGMIMHEGMMLYEMMMLREGIKLSPTLDRLQLILELSPRWKVYLLDAANLLMLSRFTIAPLVILLSFSICSIWT